LTDRFVAALVGHPFGLKGFVKVRPLSGESGHIRVLPSVLLRLRGTERRYEVEETAGTDTAPLVKFRGIDSPEAAQALAGAEVVVDRLQAAPLRPGEFYVEDLRRLPVVFPGGEPAGEIADVIEGGGGFLIELRLPTGDLRLVPFRNEFFGDVDIEGRRVVLLERWILE
jgi:16S rRNA processing protein RimM